MGAFGMKASSKHYQALVINKPTEIGREIGTNRLKSEKDSEFAAAADRFIFQIENTRVIIDRDSIKNLRNALSGNVNTSRREKRNLGSDYVSFDRILDMIKEEKIKH